MFSATITGLERGITHRVQISAVNDEGTGEWSDAATHDTVANSAPEFTAGATATRQLAENSSVDANVGDPLVATDSDEDAIEFEIIRTNDGSFTIEETTGQIKAGDHDYDHETDMEYILTVQASDPKGGTDTIAVTVNITDVVEPPGRPAAPDITAATTTTLAVEWTAPANTGPPINDYDVQYSVSANGPWLNADHEGTGTQATIEDLQSQTTYWVRVNASNDEGTSDWSDGAKRTTRQVAATPAPTPTSTPTSTPGRTPTPRSTPTSPTDGQVFQFQIDLNPASKEYASAELLPYPSENTETTAQDSGRGQHSTENSVNTDLHPKSGTNHVPVDREPSAYASDSAYSKPKQPRHFRLKELGLCRNCGESAVPGKTRCDACAEKGRRYRRQKIANNPGICQDCGTPAVQGKSRCDQCAEKRRLSYAKKQRDKNAESYSTAAS